MKLEIEYESSWRNSFLDGSNNETLPDKGRKFVGSMTSLKKSENYIKRGVTIDTVMGVLNRLIGDQRKLYQARSDSNYYFKDIEQDKLISFKDTPLHVNQEVTYIRNITGSTDQNSYTGMIGVDDPIFCSDYSTQLWGVLDLDLEGLYDFAIEGASIKDAKYLDPLSIIGRLEELFKLKPIASDDKVTKVYDHLDKKFDKFKGVNSKGEILPVSLYCSALYLQLERLSSSYDIASAKTKAGGLSGISNNGFTKKDFMARYTTGEKKKIWGNPYIRKEKVKGVGEVVSMLEKASGTLVINIDVDKNTAKDIAQKIECAGVSSFYLGKKGLAYVSNIRV